MKKIISVLSMILILYTLTISAYASQIDYAAELKDYNIKLENIEDSTELTLKDVSTLLMRLQHVDKELTLADAKKYKVITCEDYTEESWNNKVTKFTATEIVSNYCRAYKVDLTEINKYDYMDKVLKDWFDTPELFGKTTKVLVKAGIMTRENDYKFNGKRNITYGDMKGILLRIVNPQFRVKLAEFDDYNKLITEFSTVTTSNKNRNFNVNKAAEALNDYVIHPNQIFSYKDIIGSASKAAGYKESTIISGGKYVKGYGGGVCQDATTLFNAALRANLEIVERRAHGLKTSYVDPGYDATYASGSIDFRFKNTYNNPIKIKASFNYNNNTLTIGLYGSEYEEAPEVKLYTTGKGHSWTLYREVNGVVNYTTKSYYKD